MPINETHAANDDRSPVVEINHLHDAYSVSGSSPPVRKPSEPNKSHDQLPRLAYTPDEAAHVIGVSRSLFYERVYPHLKTVRLGRKRIIPVVELDLFLSTRASRALP